MRILVVLTGGTIGSTVSGDYISPDKNAPAKIVKMYTERYGNDDRFEITCPYTVLSENMNCTFYPRLIECLKEACMRNYDGIIVTHGSDTLQYTAAVLSYTLTGRNCPIVLVSSNYVLEDERANGLDNFKGAVDFIRGGYGRGVFVSYKNTGENTKIHHGLRCMPHLLYSDYLYSFNDEYYGEWDGEQWVYNDRCSRLTINKRYRIVDNIPEETGILWIKQYPGMKYPRVDSFIKAVMLESYHSGTINVASREIKDFAKQVRNYDIPVYLTGATPGPDYASCSEYEKMGIRVLPQESPIASYVRLWLMYCASEIV